MADVASANRFATLLDYCAVVRRGDFFDTYLPVCVAATQILRARRLHDQTPDPDLSQNLAYWKDAFCADMKSKQSMTYAEYLATSLNKRCHICNGNGVSPSHEQGDDVIYHSAAVRFCLVCHQPCYELRTVLLPSGETLVCWEQVCKKCRNRMMHALNGNMSLVLNEEPMAPEAQLFERIMTAGTDLVPADFHDLTSHTFIPKMPELDLNSRGLQQMLEGAQKYSTATGVDGWLLNPVELQKLPEIVLDKLKAPEHSTALTTHLPSTYDQLMNLAKSLSVSNLMTKLRDVNSSINAFDLLGVLMSFKDVLSDVPYIGPWINNVTPVDLIQEKPITDIEEEATLLLPATDAAAQRKKELTAILSNEAAPILPPTLTEELIKLGPVEMLKTVADSKFDPKLSATLLKAANVPPVVDPPFTKKTTSDKKSDKAEAFSSAVGGSVVIRPQDSRKKPLFGISPAAFSSPALSERENIHQVLEEFFETFFNVLPELGSHLIRLYAILHPERFNEPRSLLRDELVRPYAGMHPSIINDLHGVPEFWKPSTGYDQYLAARHNKLMHALNGNLASKAELASAFTDVVGEKRAPPSNNAADAQDGKKIKLTDDLGTIGTMVDFTNSAQTTCESPVTKLLARLDYDLSGKDTCFIVTGQSTNQNVQNWARNQTLFGFTFNNSGQQACGAFMEQYFSEKLACSTTVIETAPITCCVGATGNTSICTGWSKPAASYATAANEGDMLMGSQIVRINTLSVNGNSLGQEVVLLNNKIKSGAVGSAASIMAKLLLYASQNLPLAGPEITVPGCDFRMSSPLETQVPATWWPNTQGAVNAQPVINARACNFSDWANYEWAQAADFTAGWAFSDWGVSCAVVPVTQDMLGRPALVAMWTLAFLEYPYQEREYRVTNISQAYTGVTTQKYIKTNAGTGRIPGPQINVLYVVCNNANNGGGNTAPTVKVGSGGTIVDVNVYTNRPNGGVNVNIGAALTVAFGSAGDSVLGTLSAIRQWGILFGNESDYKTALIVAADMSYNCPQPLITSNGTPVATTAWKYSVANSFNVAGYANYATGAGTIGFLAGGCTGPLSIFRSNVVNDNATDKIVMQMGVVDAEVIIGLASGVITCSERLQLGRVADNLGTIGSTLRSVARTLTLLVDATLARTGMGMGELMFTGNVGGSGAQNLTFNAWTGARDVMLRMLGSIGVHGLELYWDHIPGLANSFWTEIGNNNALFGWARSPKHLLLTAGCEDPTPIKSRIGPLGSITVGQGIPTINDYYSVLEQDAPYGDTQSKAWMAYAYSQCTYPTTRFATNLQLTVKGGGQFEALYFANLIPGYMRSICNFLNSFGAPTINTSSSWIDWPLGSPIPYVSSYFAANVYLCYTGEDVGGFDRAEVPQYLMPIYRAPKVISDVFRYGGSDTSGFSKARDGLANLFRS